MSPVIGLMLVPAALFSIVCGDQSITLVSSKQLLGASINNPSNQYLKHALAQPQKLAQSVLNPGINTALITDYPIASDTGCWQSSKSLVQSLWPLSVTPHLSRDGGKGGSINGTNLFIFCDTAGFTNATDLAEMVSFVSSSIATDSGSNGPNGHALTLVDHIGEWQDDVGRMRGFAPLTTGEEAFNKALSGQGYRYAVWPQSSLVLLNKTHGLLYPSLVYDEVDMSTQAANFTTLGNTLLLVSIDPIYGPLATRVVNRLFTENEVQWGSLGGYRSWGASGAGNNDGYVYVFGQVEEGIFVARTTPAGFADRSSYQYWCGISWSSGMIPSHSTTSYMLQEPVMDLDIIYSPHHKAFFAIYLTPDADNTFYVRYLNSTTGDGQDLVSNSWSGRERLYTTPNPPESYIYAGGVHAGYFDQDDITNGGRQMLISWTQHTGKPATSPESGYAHMTAIINFN